MHVLTIDVPHLGNRTHLVHDGRVGVVIDPPRDLTAVESAAEEAGVDIVAVAETHIHNDYVSGGLCLSNRHGAEYLVAADEEVEFDRIGVHDNETLAFGDIDLRVIATSRAHAAARVLPGDRRHPGGRRRRRAVQRRQPAARHRRAHRPRRPHLVHRPGPRPVALGRDASARCRPRPRCTRPTASAASARARPRRRRRARSRSPTSTRRTRTDDSEGHLRHAACSRVSGRCPATTPTWRRATGRGRGRRVRRPGSTATAALEALARGAQVVDVRSSEALRGRPPAWHARDPRRTPVRGVRRLGDAVGSRARVPLRLRGGARRARERARLDRHRGRCDRDARVDDRASWSGLRRTDWAGFVADAARTERRRPGRTPPRGVARRAPRRLPQHRRARAPPAARRDPARRGLGALRGRLPRDGRGGPARPRRPRRRAGRRRVREGPRARNSLAGCATAA